MTFSFDPPPEADPPHPWRSGATAAIIALVVGGAISLAWLVHPFFEPTTDSSIYLATARSMLRGDGYAYLGEPFTHRPPGMSVLLLPFLGEFPTDFRVLNLLVSGFGVAAIVLLFVHLRPRLGVLPSMAVAAAVWLNPLFQSLCNQVMSDVPGVTLLFGAVAVERWAWRGGSRRDVALGLLLAAATYLRTVLVLLVPAILIARWFRQRRPEAPAGKREFFGRIAMLFLIVLVLYLPWMVRNSRVTTDAVAEQTWIHSYRTLMFQEKPSDPASPQLSVGEVFARVPDQFGWLVARLGSRLAGEENPVSPPLGGAFLACLLVVLVRRRGVAEWFALFNLALLCVFPVKLDRLLLPVFLIALGCAAEVVLWLLQKVAGRRAAPLLVAATALVLLSLDLDLRQGWTAIERQHHQRLEVCQYLHDEVPPDVPIIASFGGHYSAILGRPVYSYRIARTRRGNPGAVEVIRRHKIGIAIVRERTELFPLLSGPFGVHKQFGSIAIIQIDDLEKLPKAVQRRRAGRR